MRAETPYTGLGAGANNSARRFAAMSDERKARILIWLTSRGRWDTYFTLSANNLV